VGVLAASPATGAYTTLTFYIALQYEYTTVQYTRVLYYKCMYLSELIYNNSKLRGGQSACLAKFVGAEERTGADGGDRPWKAREVYFLEQVFASLL
jgi:hypothetical protein